MVMGTTLTLALAVTGVLVYYGYSIVHFANSISTASGTSSSSTSNPQADPGTDTTTTPIPKWEGKERVNILLLGVTPEVMMQGAPIRSWWPPLIRCPNGLIYSLSCEIHMWKYPDMAKAGLTQHFPTGR